MTSDPEPVRLDGPVLVLEGTAETGTGAYIRLSPLSLLQVREGETGRAALTFKVQISLPGFAAQVADECGRKEWECLSQALTQLTEGGPGPFWFAGVGHRFGLRFAGREGKVLPMGVAAQSPFTDGLCKQEPDGVALGCDRGGLLSALQFAFFIDRKTLDQPLRPLQSLLPLLRTRHEPTPEWQKTSEVFKTSEVCRKHALSCKLSPLRNLLSNAP